MTADYSLLDHLACPKCSEKYSGRAVQGLCRCGSPLLASYHLESAKEAFAKRELTRRVKSLWRYHELLPVLHPENVVSLGEGMTPLLAARRIAEETGLRSLYIKDEGVIPTGTFKARGAAVGVSKAKELGVRAIAMPTNGNAGAAWSAYAARAGIDCYIGMPRDAPSVTMAECLAYGARLFLVDGHINQVGRMVEEACRRQGIFNVSTLREPYRVEGKKTMGFEIAEQLGWKAPDVVIYPTGGGVGLIGVHKAMQELAELGWVQSKGTRLVAVQSTGCAPVVEAWKRGARECVPWENPRTVAFGINVPKPLGDFLILESLYDSRGCAVAVDDSEILRAQRSLGAKEGVFACPEGAATLAALNRLVSDGWVDRDETVVLLNTGSGIKYPETVPVDAPLYRADQSVLFDRTGAAGDSGRLGKTTPD